MNLPTTISKPSPKMMMVGNGDKKVSSHDVSDRRRQTRFVNKKGDNFITFCQAKCLSVVDRMFKLFSLGLFETNQPIYFFIVQNDHISLYHFLVRMRSHNV